MDASAKVESVGPQLRRATHWSFSPLQLLSTKRIMESVSNGLVEYCNVHTPISSDITQRRGANGALGPVVIQNSPRLRIESDRSQLKQKSSQSLRNPPRSPLPVQYPPTVDFEGSSMPISPVAPVWAPAPGRSVTFDAKTKPSGAAPGLRDVPGTAAAISAGRQSVFGPASTSGEPATPFSDGVVEKSERYSEDHLCPQMAFKLEWPLEEADYNRRRKVGEYSKLNPSGGPSLLYYRKYLEMDGQDDTMHTSVKLTRNTNQAESSVPGKVLFRVICEKPCWATETRRYEAPIQIGVGRAGPIIYEVHPAAPKGGRGGKRQSQWTLHRINSTLQTRARTEDLEGSLISFLSPWGMPFQVYAHNESKIKMDYRDQEYEVAQFDPHDDFGALHIDARPYGTPFRNERRSAIEMAYLIAIFETAHAMRDELAGGGKGRRDEYGRLALAKRNAVAKAFSRMLKT